MLTMLFVFFDLRRLGDSGCTAVIASSDFLMTSNYRALVNVVSFSASRLLNSVPSPHKTLVSVLGQKESSFATPDLSTFHQFLTLDATEEVQPPYISLPGADFRLHFQLHRTRQLVELGTKEKDMHRALVIER